jgi:hypothetical protein
MTMRLFLIALLGIGLGCVARTAANIVTLPIRAAGAGVDALTTSREEADRNRGRAIRKQEEREAKERKRQEKQWREAQRYN